MEDNGKFMYAKMSDVVEILGVTPQWARVLVDKYLHGNSEYVFRLGTRGQRRVTEKGLRHLITELNMPSFYMKKIDDLVNKNLTEDDNKPKTDPV